MQITCYNTGALGVNTYLVVDETTKKGFIVDPGGYSTALKKQIDEDGIEIEYILLTHGHSDHICGVNAHRRELPAAKVAAHEAEKEMLSDAAFNMSTQFGAPETVEADLFLKDGDILQVGNMELQIMHTPGHSPGGMCIYAPQFNVLFSGDTLFRQSVGRTDFPGCDFRAMRDAIKKKLFTLPEQTQVFPGHMGATEIGFEKENNPFVI